MMRELTLRQVGGSIGATIPKDMADRLHLAVGDRVLTVETERGPASIVAPPAIRDGRAPELGPVPAIGQHSAAIRREFAVNAAAAATA